MILDRLGKELLFFDGGMGTMLQAAGLEPGELPELWNITHPEVVRRIHRSYMEAGSDILLTNTFGANALKFHDKNCSLKEIVSRALSHALDACKLAEARGRKVYAALSIGPTGKLLKPMGDLGFEEAYEAFKEVVEYAVEAGADLIHIETMSDTYEIKAAALAAKENCDLPVFVTAIFDERRKLLTGASVPAVVAMLEGLRVDALGINCGLGPAQMLPILDELRTCASLPLIVKPNAGLPRQIKGETCYDVDPQEFAAAMAQTARRGAALLGGCCGTTPSHIRAMIDAVKGMEPKKIRPKELTFVSSYGRCVCLGRGSKIIGERINPTGKKRFRQALKEGDMDYILKEGILQEDKGAHILDVNVGLPDIDEAKVIKEVVTELQSVTSLPLQIDTVDTKAMEAALRIYNGKPMINSVNGKQESMDAVFPLIRRYGGVVVGLTLDEQGIPPDAEGRLKIARRIIEEAGCYGIHKKDVVIDVLAMTVSSEPSGAKVTLEALKRVREELGVNTVLGVSNISFGLPQRPVINSAFYAMAMLSGLSAGIINPLSEDMMKSYFAFNALMNLDENCEQYIAAYAGRNACVSVCEPGDMTLKGAIEKGLKEEAKQITKALVTKQAPLAIIDAYLIPALDTVGKGFEEGSIFLPQLLMSAEAAKAAFAILREKLSKEGMEGEKKEKVVLATVKGDIHDIGKNIVKVLLENYGFDVIDLGKDVAPELIVERVLARNVKLVGLSALMTTTVANMEETIRRLRKSAPDCRIMVGGAVLNQEYADMIGADFYGRDAMQSVYYAQETLNKQKTGCIT